jgi:hypothetical protein
MAFNYSFVFLKQGRSKEAKVGGCSITFIISIKELIIYWLYPLMNWLYPLMNWLFIDYIHWWIDYLLIISIDELIIYLLYPLMNWLFIDYIYQSTHLLLFFHVRQKIINKFLDGIL